MNWWQQLLLIVAGNALVGIISWITMRSTIRKARAEAKTAEKKIVQTDAETSKTYAEASNIVAQQLKDALARIDNLEEENFRVESKVEDLERKVDYYEKGVNILINQLRHNGFEPAWIPEVKHGSSVQ